MISARGLAGFGPRVPILKSVGFQDQSGHEQIQSLTVPILKSVGFQGQDTSGCGLERLTAQSNIVFTPSAAPASPRRRSSVQSVAP